MKSTLFAGIALIVLGLIGLVYGSFGETQASQKTSFGPVTVAVAEQRAVNVPAWLGGGAIALGLVLVLTREKT
ncbi:MAG: hypothetical protein U1A22_15100 [Xanthomonadaceae bacterium]|nr:hypothetical protein [Xanthomonadaceae bacterium]